MFAPQHHRVLRRRCRLPRCGRDGVQGRQQGQAGVHNVEGNKATIDSFTQSLQSNQSTPVRGDVHDDGERAGHRRLRRRPLQRRAGLPRDPDRADASNVQVIVNSSGEYSCNQSGAGGAWSCQKLGQADAATQNKIFDIYTPVALGLLPQGRLTGGRAGR